MLTIKRLSIEDARVLIEGARAKAEEIGVPMCIAITDESGQLMAFERMDGGKITSTIIAQDKAYTAAGAKRTTESYGVASQPGIRDQLSDRWSFNGRRRRFACDHRRRGCRRDRPHLRDASAGHSVRPSRD